MTEMIGSDAGLLRPRGAWSSSATYAPNDMAIRNGVAYAALLAVPANQDPANPPAPSTEYSVSGLTGQGSGAPTGGAYYADYTPSTSFSLTGATFGSAVGCGLNGSNLTLTVTQGGTTVATSAVVPTAAGYTAVTTFTFPTPVTLQGGVTYRFTLSATNVSWHGSLTGGTITGNGSATAWTLGSTTGAGLNWTIIGAPVYWQPLGASNPGLYGDGSDGAATLDGTTTVGWATLSGSTYTLSRDVNATNLTINSGVILATNNFRIFATGTLTNNGTISNDGGAGSGSGGGSSASQQILMGSGTGGTGNTGQGGAGNNAVAASLGGAGGAGGAGGTGAAGAAGTVTAYAGGTNAARNFAAITQLALVIAGSINPLRGGAGGGGGGGDGTNRGGGGGAGGGVVAVYARLITNNGTIRANGGAGAAGVAGNAGGGGGGGGGAVLVLSASSQNGTVQVNGGAGGALVGTGTAGSAGAAGNIYWLSQ